jgi:hypothetical protein
MEIPWKNAEMMAIHAEIRQFGLNIQHDSTISLHTNSDIEIRSNQGTAQSPGRRMRFIITMHHAPVASLSLDISWDWLQVHASIQISEQIFNPPVLNISYGEPWKVEMACHMHVTSLKLTLMGANVVN